MFIRQTKNDTIDALIVAEVIRFGRFFSVDMASDLKRKIIAPSFSFIIRQYLEQFESCIATFDAEISRLMDNFYTSLEKTFFRSKTCRL